VNSSDPLYWLHNLLITAREDDDKKDEDQDDEGDDGDDDGEEGEDEGQDSGADSKSDKDKDEDDEDDPAKLKEALKKERRLRRRFEREARRATKKSTAKDDEGQGDDSGADDKEGAKLRKKLDSSEQRSRRLAEGFRKKLIDDAIVAEARKQGFIDPTDALLDDIRDEVDYEQDKDDPSQVEIDTDSVEDAVKDLADRKKHLIGSPEDRKNKSGGKFKGKRGGSDGDKSTEEKLRDEYPSLR
jgi:hypothetical protein